MTKFTFAGATAAALFTLAPTGALAQNDIVQANTTATTATPPATTSPPDTDAADPATTTAPRSDPALPPPVTTDSIVTTTTPAPTVTTPDLSLPPLEPVNPYANSYNETLPLEIEEDRGFDDWGLLGLLGLLGLFGLRRGRERIVYVERAETIRTTEHRQL
jgi:MYXO-CTERM domain-containing protein